MFKNLKYKILSIVFFRDLIIGLFTTFKYIFKRRVTLNYPNEKGPLSPRFKGEHALRRYQSGEEDVDRSIALGMGFFDWTQRAYL